MIKLVYVIYLKVSFQEPINYVKTCYTYMYTELFLVFYTFLINILPTYWFYKDNSKKTTLFRGGNSQKEMKCSNIENGHYNWAVPNP